MAAWTPQQQAAIESRGRNLLVSAAAGAGKTSVLVERIVQQIIGADSELDVDRLLVVTFTNAAAAQMREQIGRALTRELEKNPGSRHLRKQLHLLNRAQITTLHSFCLDVIRKHFYRVNLDPGFRIMDEAEAGLLQMEVLDQLLEDAYTDSGEQNFFDLVDAYGGERNDAGLADMVLMLHRFACANPWPQAWLETIKQGFDEDAPVTVDDYPWCPMLKETIRLQLTAARQGLENAAALCRLPRGPIDYEETLLDESAGLENLMAACGGSWQEMFESFETFCFGRLKSMKKSDQLDPEMQERVKALRDTVKSRVNGLKGTYFVSDAQARVQEMQLTAPLMRKLIDLVIDFRLRYTRAKQLRGLADFNDLEHYCLMILGDFDAGTEQSVPSQAALELRAQFAEVLVDEYQDINKVQEAILQLVSRQDGPAQNLFMVGDVKQSIYRFRLADPEIFLGRYHTARQNAQENDGLIHLRENFRSSQAVVDGVNDFFRQLMTGYVGEISYDADAELVCGQRIPECPDPDKMLKPGLSVMIITGDQNDGEEAGPEPEAQTGETASDGSGAEPGDNQEESDEMLENSQAEARIVAQQIRSLVDSRALIWDKHLETYRPVAYRDFAVLMRATRGISNLFADELKQAGIPAYAELATGYFSAVEVEILLALLKVIDNPRQDIPLLTVLRSPIMGLNARQLAAIRLCDREHAFYDAMKKAAEEEHETGPALKRFLANLERWRTMARRESITSLLWAIYRDTDYYDYLGAMPGGVQRQANLRLFLTWAARFEATNFRGLYHFLRFIERMRETGQDMGMARTVGENEDVVRIMSIHKSKGLEFPVVFVCGLARRFNMMDLARNLLIHKDFGVGPQFVDLDTSVTYPTLAKLAIREQIRRETLAEEMRLLYVAMTRAREKLVLVGVVPRLAGRVQEWCRVASQAKGPLPDAELMQARCYLDWVGPAAVRLPAGRELRQLAGEQNIIEELNSESPLLLSLIPWEQAVRQVSGMEPAAQELIKLIRQKQPLPAEAEQEALVGERLSWQYPYERIAGRRAKLTVTEIKRVFDQLMAEEQTGRHEPSDPVQGQYDARPGLRLTDRPRFLQEGRTLTAPERGTAIHLALQHLDLNEADQESAVCGQIDSLCERGILNAEQRAAVKPAEIVRFFAHDIGQRVIRSGSVMRELPFSMALPADEWYQGLSDATDQIVIQGVIDLLFEEEDGCVIVDFKTNRVNADSLDLLTQEYRWQMVMYAMAVERILKKPVKGKYLFFLSEGIACAIE